MTAPYPTRSQQERQRLAAAGKLLLLDYAVLATCLVLMPSAVLHSLLGVDQKIIFAALVPLIIVGATLAQRWPSRGGTAMILLILSINGFLASLVADNYSQALMGLTLSISLLGGYQLAVTLRKKAALKVASWLALLLLIGGVVGILYSYLFRAPMYEIQIGYRTTYLYLTTFSFAQIGDFIRPSGIFDEPGALAMYVAVVTMFNDTWGVNRRLNFALVTLLVITGSFVGLILVVLYFATSNSVGAARKKNLAAAALLTGAYLLSDYAIPSNPVSAVVNTFYSERLEIVDGRLSGDNRSGQIYEFLELLDSNIFWRGQKASGIDYFEQDQSSNPFSIVFGYGFIISLPYFALLIWLVTTTLRSRFVNSYASLGLLILLLQRPYIYHLGWSILIASVVWLLLASDVRRNESGGTVRRKA